MKKILKKCTVFVVATLMITALAIPVNAVAHVQGCGASDEEKRCGTYQMTISGSHHLHTNVYCSTLDYVYSHYYVCANPICGVQTRTGLYETCTRVHQICKPDETGLCKQKK